MTRATSTVGEELLALLGSMVVDKSVHDVVTRYHVTIESDLIRPEDNGCHVETIIDEKGGLRFRRADYGYDT